MYVKVAARQSSDIFWGHGVYCNVSRKCHVVYNLWRRWCRALRSNHSMLCHCMIEMSLWRSASGRRHHADARSDLLYRVRRVLWRGRRLVSRRRRLLRRLLLLLLTRLTVTWHRRSDATVRCNVNHLRHCMSTTATYPCMMHTLLNYHVQLHKQQSPEISTMKGKRCNTPLKHSGVIIISLS